MNKGKIFIEGVIGRDYTPAMLDAQIDNLGDIDVLDVYINSGGGYTVDGYGIHDRLASLPYTVNTIANGMVASIATVIFQAPKTQNKGGKRMLYKNSEPFIHNPHWQPDENSNPIESKDARDLFDSLVKEEAKLNSFYSSVTSIESDKIQSIMNDAKTLTPQDFIELGFADEIIATNIQAFTKYRLVAYINNNNKQTEMDNKEIKAEIGGIKGLLNKISKALFKNAYTETLDGMKIYFEGTMVMKDTPVFEDEAMTIPLKDGTYTLDSITLTVAGGIVTAVEEVLAQNTPDALTEANAKIAELEAQLAEKTTLVAEKETVLNETKEEFLALAKKVEKFEATFVTGQNFQANGGQSQGKDEPTASNETVTQKVARLRAEKDAKK